MKNSNWVDILVNGPRIPYLDNCPQCRDGKLNAPVAPVYQYGVSPDGVRADYACWNCRHQWTTGWQRDDAASAPQLHEINPTAWHTTNAVTPDTCPHCEETQP